MASDPVQRVEATALGAAAGAAQGLVARAARSTVASLFSARARQWPELAHSPTPIVFGEEYEEQSKPALRAIWEGAERTIVYTPPHSPEASSAEPTSPGPPHGSGSGT